MKNIFVTVFACCALLACGDETGTSTGTGGGSTVSTGGAGGTTGDGGAGGSAGDGGASADVTSVGGAGGAGGSQ